MGCASAKHVSTVQNEEEAQKGKNFQNGDVFGEEFRIRTVEEVKYMKNVNREESDWSEKGHAGHEDEQKVAARNQENLQFKMCNVLWGNEIYLCFVIMVAEASQAENKKHNLAYLY
ncbi:hypothetical protein scyTo_0011923 [Scyliorhinus torazame]|uniref:Uncharacterized protein n=1 Tax=Scyliorhinus torazame TaxID=75743 RepID=A0A401NYC0_SCYTO|nr:hypothetical protein [Scyliorhinus torazame]